MAELKKHNYMEMQMEELKATYADDKVDSPPKKNNANKSEKNAAIAKLYEDAAEYEEDLQVFEDELEVITSNELKNIPALLTQKFPDEERDFAQELKAIVVASWTHFVEVEKTHPKEQLEMIKETEFCDFVENLNAQYPDNTDGFEEEIKSIMLKRWEMLIGIKKEHIKQEHDEIKIAGLKPKWVKKIYEKFHDIS